MEFVRSLKPEHWQSFWYFASEFGFGLIAVFETLLLTTLTADMDIRASMTRMDEYQWTLKMAKKNTGFLDNSIAMVDLAARYAKQRVANIDVPSVEYQDHSKEYGINVSSAPLESTDWPGKDNFDFWSPSYVSSLSPFECCTYQNPTSQAFHGMGASQERGV